MIRNAHQIMSLPEGTSAVYAFVGKGKVFYIGSTGCLRRRFSSHDKRRICERHGCDEVRWVEVEDDHRDRVESELIAFARPRFNVKDKPKTLRSYSEIFPLAPPSYISLIEGCVINYSGSVLENLCMKPRIPASFLQHQWPHMIAEMESLIKKGMKFKTYSYTRRTSKQTRKITGKRNETVLL